MYVLLQYSETSYYFHIHQNDQYQVLFRKVLQKSLKFWVKCDYFEALHIGMHVQTSNLNIAGKGGLWFWSKLGKAIFDKMVESTLIPNLPKNIVAKCTMPNVMELIMVVTPNPSHRINHDVSLRDFMVLLCTYKCMGVNKAWCLHFGMGEVHDAFRLALFELSINENHLQ